MSTNALLQEAFKKFFTKEESITPLVVEKIEQAKELWLQHYPIITIVDVLLPWVNPYQFINKLLPEIDITHSPHSFLFITDTDPMSIEATKKALQIVRNGDLVVKNIRQDTEKDSISEIMISIEHVYRLYLSEHLLASSRPLELEQKYLNSPSFCNTDIVLSKIKKNPIKMVIIGISTGGPLVLRKLFGQLKNIHYPLVVVQHMIPDFIEGYVQALSSFFHFPIQVAQQGTILKNGIYFAPDNAHLRISQIEGELTVLLEHSKPIKGYMPSIEAVFDSVLKEDIPCLGILMTGLGDDGASNLKLLHDKGYPTIAQSDTDAVVFGMPHALIKQDGADGILTIPLIAQVLNEI